jgi:hypothetical protein
MSQIHSSVIFIDRKEFEFEELKNLFSKLCRRDQCVQQKEQKKTERENKTNVQISEQNSHEDTGLFCTTLSSQVIQHSNCRMRNKSLRINIWIDYFSNS